MKSMGIVRRIDELGRVVIPRELRRTLDIKDNDPVEIFTEEDGNIVLRKYQPGCICCNRLDNLKQLPNGFGICADCLSQIK